jgi:signal transduction histidine kinase
MNRSYRYSLVSVLLVTAVVSCMAGVGVGLWTVLDSDAGAGSMLLRGVLAMIAVALVALIPAWILSHSFLKSTQEIASAIGQLRQGTFICDPQASSPAELQDIAKGLREMGVYLEERDRESGQRSRQEAHALRQEALIRFGHGVAREVQKSFAGVIGFVEIALRQPGVEGQLKNYLTLIEQEARSGREALERVLRYVREEPFPTEPLEVNALVVDASKGFLETTEKEHVQLNLAKDIPQVMGDPTQLKFVLTALINNAREAIPPEGGTLEISTNVDQEGHVVIMVKDDGGGIPQDDQPSVFTPFFTSKGSQKGAGLSLAISERIISRHGGKLEFWSDLGKGSVFFVSLPAVQKSRAADASLEGEAEEAVE